VHMHMYKEASAVLRYVERTTYVWLCCCKVRAGLLMVWKAAFRLEWMCNRRRRDAS
jgi:hypothetical protein